MDDRNLGVPPGRESALSFVLDFAARQRHGLENPLVAEGRFLIGFFRLGAILDPVLLIRAKALFCHK
jgi:hypothetical protein